MKEDPPADAKCRDKFLVQSVAISADKEVANVSQIVCLPACLPCLYSKHTNTSPSGLKSSKPPSLRYRRRRSVSSSCLPKAQPPAPAIPTVSATLMIPTTPPLHQKHKLLKEAPSALSLPLTRSPPIPRAWERSATRPTTLQAKTDLSLAPLPTPFPHPPKSCNRDCPRLRPRLHDSSNKLRTLCYARGRLMLSTRTPRKESPLAPPAWASSKYPPAVSPYKLWQVSVCSASLSLTSSSDL